MNLLNSDIRCKEESEHSPHEYILQEARECDGKAECGAWSHPFHKFESYTLVRCPGVCDCGLLQGLHGPGAHK